MCIQFCMVLCRQFIYVMWTLPYVMSTCLYCHVHSSWHRVKYSLHYMILLLLFKWTLINMMLKIHLRVVHRTIPSTPICATCKAAFGVHAITTGHLPVIQPDVKTSYTMCKMALWCQFGLKSGIYKRPGALGDNVPSIKFAEFCRKRFLIKLYLSVSPLPLFLV